MFSTAVDTCKQVEILFAADRVIDLTEPNFIDLTRAPPPKRGRCLRELIPDVDVTDPEVSETLEQAVKVRNFLGFCKLAKKLQRRAVACAGGLRKLVSLQHLYAKCQCKKRCRYCADDSPGHCHKPCHETQSCVTVAPVCKWLVQVLSKADLFMGFEKPTGVFAEDYVPCIHC